ncbi:MAG: hypothetical protein QXF26_04945 [Candidatus Bathyarchaeia archaeon]
MREIYLGTSDWSYDEWVGFFKSRLHGYTVENCLYIKFPGLSKKQVEVKQRINLYIRAVDLGVNRRDIVFYVSPASEKIRVEESLPELASHSRIRKGHEALSKISKEPSSWSKTPS